MDNDLTPNDLDNIYDDSKLNPDQSTLPEYFIKDGKMQKVQTVDDWLEAYYQTWIAYRKCDA